MVSSGMDSIEELLHEYLGNIGIYHIQLLLMTMTFKVSTAFHSLGIIFLAPPVKYNCTIDNVTLTNNHCPCDTPIYDRSHIDDTMITKWNLICDQSWLASFAQTVMMLGFFVGSITFGTISDRYGRKMAVFITVVLEFIAGIAAGVVSVLWLYLVLRFFIGCAVGGMMIVGFVLVMEFTGKNQRELMTCLLNIPYVFGCLLLPLFAYLIKSWTWLNMTYTLSLIGYIFVHKLIPESPRWLIMAGRKDEAIATLKKIAVTNKRPIDGLEATVNACCERMGHTQVSKYGTASSWRDLGHPVIRKNLFCATVNWIVCSFGFFGVSQYIGQLSGDVYLNQTMSAGFLVVATIFSYFFITRLSRRTVMIASNLCTAACLGSLSFVQHQDVVAVLIACVGNFGMYVNFVVIYLYTAELFPTVVRNIAMGIAGMMSRLGAMSAPFVATMGTKIPWLPPVIFGVAPLIAAALCFILPETKHEDLPDAVKRDENVKMDEITGV